MKTVARTILAAILCLWTAAAAAQVVPPNAAQISEATRRSAQDFAIHWSSAQARGHDVLARCLVIGSDWEDDGWDEIPIGFVDNMCSFNIRMRFAPGVLTEGRCVRDPAIAVQEITAAAAGSITWERVDKFDCLFDASILGVDTTPSAPVQLPKAKDPPAPPAPSPSEAAQQALVAIMGGGKIELRNQVRKNGVDEWFLWRQVSSARVVNSCYTELTATKINGRSANVTSIDNVFNLSWSHVNNVELDGRFVRITGSWMYDGEYASLFHPDEAAARRTFQAMKALEAAC